MAPNDPPPTTLPESVGDFYARVETAVPELDERLHIFLDEYAAFRRARDGVLQVLDIGCGRKALLAHAIDPADEYTGCDIVEPDQMGIERFVAIDLNQERLAARLEGQRFDVVFCGGGGRASLQSRRTASGPAHPARSRWAACPLHAQSRL